MPFDEHLLEMVRCPLTLTELRHLSPAELATINRRIANGEVINRSGEPVCDRLDDALINKDNSWLMPIREGILTLVADQLISSNYKESLGIGAGES